MKVKEYSVDYLPVRMEKSLRREEQEAVKTFFQFLIAFNRHYSVSKIMTAYRRARMTNVYRGKGSLYANL